MEVGAIKSNRALRTRFRRYASARWKIRVKRGRIVAQGLTKAAIKRNTSKH